MISSKLRSSAARDIARRLYGVRYSTESASCDAATTKSVEDIPGPPSLPVIGLIHHFLPHIGMFGSVKHSNEMMEVMHRRFGDLVRIGPVLKKPTTIFCFDTADIEMILRNENTTPIRAGFLALEHFRHDLMKENYEGTTGLLTDHGEAWKKFRSAVNPVFLQPKTIKKYATAIDQVAQDMVNRLKRIRNPDNTISEDVEIELNKWALESIAVVGLGTRVGCLVDDLPEDSPARQLIQCVRDCFEVLDELEFQLSPWQYFTTPTYKKGMAIFDKQMKLSEMYVKQAREALKNRPETADEDKSILEKLLEIDDKVAIIMASDMLFAGVDTAAHTMMTLLYNLAVNPEKQDKLREEIKAGAEKKYLKACIKENLRLTPVVSGNLRKATKEHKLRNYIIPEGTDFIFAHEYISRLESQYARAKEFIPERWLVSKGDPLHYGSAHPMATMPFGHGVRSCIGRRVAELEIETFLSRVIENFEVQWKGPPPTIVTKSLNYMKPPYCYIFNDVK